MNLVHIVIISYCFTLGALDAPVDSTIHEVDSGNWYEKLQWWKKAKPKYEEVKNIVASIAQQEKIVRDRLAAVDKQLDELFAALRINVTTIVPQVAKSIDETKKALEIDQAGSAQVQKADVLKELEELRDAINVLTSFREQLRKTIPDILTAQIKTAQAYQEKALESFEQIENILDDQKARYLYDTIENSGDNSNALLGYVKNSLSSYIDQISTRIGQLKVVLQKVLDDLEKQNIVLRTPEVQPVEQKKEPPQQQEGHGGWWGTIKAFFINIWNSIKNFFVGIYRYFVPVAAGKI